MRWMLRHSRLATVLGLTLLTAVVVVGVAIATPSSGVTAETYRGDVQGQLKLFTKFSLASARGSRQRARSRSSRRRSWRNRAPRSAGTTTLART